jgi:hypothetical protein
MSKYTTRTEILSDLNSMIEAGTLPARIIATLANALGQLPARAVASLADAVDCLENTAKCSGCGKMSTQRHNSYGNKVSSCCSMIAVHEPWTKRWDSKLEVWVD